MTEEDLSFLPLKVINVGVTGKRTFDPHGKRRLIEACRQTGVSISGLALKAGINANQLRKWLRADEQQAAVGAPGTAERVTPAFIPVVTRGEVGVEAVQAVAQAAAVPARLRAQLPNGVTLELECGGRDGALLKAMIQALGAR